MSKIRVLHCLASIAPSYGGPVAVLKGLSRHLTPLGVSSTILSCSTGDAKKDKHNSTAFPGIDFMWAYPKVFRFYWEPFLSERIRRVSKDFDLLHIHGFFNGVVSAACHAARENNIPYILEPFGTLSPNCLSRNRFLKRLFLNGGAETDIEKADAVFFTSEFERVEASKNFSVRKSFIAPNGIDWAEFDPLPPFGAFRKKLGINAESGVFLFVGRLHPIKGLEVFLLAFLDWCGRQSHEWLFVLVGPDENGYRKRLQLLIAAKDRESHVLFAGALYGADRIQAMVDADLVVLPSFHENFGIAALEGMACGKPVLVSDQVGLYPLIQALNAGEVTSVNKEAIERAFDKIISRREAWPAMGQKARHWVGENARWERIGREVFQEYKNILQERSGR